MLPPIEPQSSDGTGPIDSTIVDQASVWLVRLWSGLATEDDYRACQAWRGAHADHERTWQRLLTFEQKFDVVPRSVAREALAKPSASPSRRATLKAIGALLVGGTAAYSVRQTTTWQRYAADYQTSIGEMREIMLADSSHATLNTASAMDVHFDTRERRVALRTGEVLIATAHDPATPARPFLVTTTHGTVRALGTRFIVRQTAEALSHVSVFEGAVTIQPLSQSAPALRIEAGQQASFSGTATQAVASVEESASAWANGSLLVERMRLDDFLRELNRYRPGILRCDPAAAHHVLTGVYPLADTDRILASLEKALPVKIVYRSRYWVTVTTR